MYVLKVYIEILKCKIEVCGFDYKCFEIWEYIVV